MDPARCAAAAERTRVGVESKTLCRPPRYNRRSGCSVALRMASRKGTCVGSGSRGPEGHACRLRASCHVEGGRTIVKHGVCQAPSPVGLSQSLVFFIGPGGLLCAAFRSSQGGAALRGGRAQGRCQQPPACGGTVACAPRLQPPCSMVQRLQCQKGTAQPCDTAALQNGPTCGVGASKVLGAAVC